MPSWKMIINFEELETLAQEIRQISGHIQNMADSSGQRVICGIKAAWGGERADAFIAKEVKHVKRLYEAGEHLSEVAKQLEEKAEQISKLEKSNVLTANTRTY